MDDEALHKGAKFIVSPTPANALEVGLVALDRVASKTNNTRKVRDEIRRLEAEDEEEKVARREEGRGLSGEGTSNNL